MKTTSKENARTRFVARLRELYGDVTADEIVRRSQERPHTSFRLVGDPSDDAQTLTDLRAEGVGFEPAPKLLPRAFVLESEASRNALLSSSANQSGRVYVQTLSSMIPPTLLAPHPGEEVLDLAAAPGGKTIVLADLMHRQGRIAAVEPVKDRFFRLKANLDRAGIRIVRLYMQDGVLVGRKVPERFDRVLLDAPCSTEARVSLGDDDDLGDWSEKKLRRMQKLQSRLLASGFAALKPGGRLVYSTCAFSPEENEAVVTSLLVDEGGQAVVVPIDIDNDIDIKNARPGVTKFVDQDFHPSVVGTMRILPEGAFEASYVAVIEKRGSESALAN